MKHEPLTPDTVLALAHLVTATRTSARVARVMDDGEIIYGTARSIGDYYGNFGTEQDDIRSGYLRVTTDTGWEAFWEMREIIPAVKAGLFVVNPTEGVRA